MIRTTKDQRLAICRVFKRAPLSLQTQQVRAGHPNMPMATYNGDATALTYRQFRKLAEPSFGMDGAIILPWAGMWLAIERDGYTHS